jgi:simple sugar transport system permease protein
MLALTPLLAVALTIAAGAILFLIMGKDPIASLRAFFITPLSTAYGLSELALKATPLVLIALGLAIGFRAGVWNIGAEGQLVLGAICGGGMGLAFYGSEGAHVLPLMLLAGSLGGMAWAAIPAFLKARLDVNEILVSLMLTYVAALLLSTLVYGPWKDPEGFNFPQSRMFTTTMPVLLEGTRLHIGALIALVAVALAWLLLARTLHGFAVTVTGLAPAAARFAGFRQERMIWGTFLLSGGLAGLAGAMEVAGPIGQLVPQVSPGYGFTAIIVAFLGRLHPVGILLAGLIVALSYIGGENAQIEVGLPQAVTGVFQGLLLFFLLATDLLVRYRLRLARPALA